MRNTLSNASLETKEWTISPQPLGRLTRFRVRSRGISKGFHLITRLERGSVCKGPNKGEHQAFLDNGSADQRAKYTIRKGVKNCARMPQDSMLSYATIGLQCAKQSFNSAMAALKPPLQLRNLVYEQSSPMPTIDLKQPRQPLHSLAQACTPAMMRQMQKLWKCRLRFFMALTQ